MKKYGENSKNLVAGSNGENFWKFFHKLGTYFLIGAVELKNNWLKPILPKVIA